MTRRPPNQRSLRGLIVVGCIALAWWAAWLFDPRNLGSPVLFAVVAAAQVVDLLAVLGFWHTVWPRKPSEAVFAPVRGRASILVVAHGQPVEMVEETLQAALSMRRRHRVFLADPFERPDLRWLPGWHGVTRLTPGLEELNELVGARFLAVFEAGQVPRPDFLQHLLPYFADRNMALVQAWYSRSGRRRSRVRHAIFRGGDALGEAPCIGSNHILRRTALHSVGGFGPDMLSLAGALRLAAALRADRWQTLYVGARLAESLGNSGPASRLADYHRWTTAELATTLHPVRRRGAPAAARFHAAWAGARHLALLGLPVSAAALVAAPLLGSLPLAWPVNLAVHLAPYVVVRAAVRLVVGASPPVDVPVLQPAEQSEDEMGTELTPPGMAEVETPQDVPKESPLDVRAVPAPQAEPEPLEPVAIAEVTVQEERDLGHLRATLSHAAIDLVTGGLRGALLRIPTVSRVEREPVEVPLAAEPSPELEPAAAAVDTGQEVAPPLEAAPAEPPVLILPWEERSAPEPEPQPARRTPSRHPRPRPGLAVAAAAWIVTVGAIGAAAFTVIQSNPPEQASSVKKVTVPPYSYYVPQQEPTAPPTR